MSASLYYPYYRSGIDVSIPFYNPSSIHTQNINQRKYVLYFMQKSVSTFYPDITKNFLNEHKIVLRTDCSLNFVKTNRICGRLFENGLTKSIVVPEYQFAAESVFCVIFNFGNSLGFHLFNALSKNCIPLVFSDKYILPFSEVLDWNRCVIPLRQYQIPDISLIISSISTEIIEYHQQHCSFFFTKYMSTMEKIIETSLSIIESRFYPIHGKSYFWWNEPDYDSIQSSSSHHSVEESIASKFQSVSFFRDIGFTAIVFVDYRCANQPSQQMMLDFSIDYLMKSSGLVHIVFVTSSDCTIKRDKLPLVKVTVIRVSATEKRLPIRYSYLSIVDTDAVLVLHWYRSLSLLTTKDINSGFEAWLSNRDQLIALRQQQCLPPDQASARYPVDAVFLQLSTMRRYSPTIATILNRPPPAPPANSDKKSCCSQDRAMSQIWPTIYPSIERFCI